MERKTAKTPDYEVYFNNREISWLQFNERVLQEAMDTANPLLERLKFLGIFSNNRDEFFRVRVATINRLVKLKGQTHFKPDYDPKVLLAQIHEIVLKQEKVFSETYRNIVEELRQQSICIINEAQLSPEQSQHVKNYFNQDVRPFAFPIMLNNVKNLSFLKDQSLYLAVQLIDSKNQLKEKAAIVKIQTQKVSRFFILPKENQLTYIILLDDVVRHCLDDIFAVLGYDTFNAYTIKFTRDAELDIDNDVSKSFLELMTESVKKRKVGVAVRFVYDANIPKPLLDKVMKKMKISDEDPKRAGGRYHNFKDLMDFPKLAFPKMRNEPFPALEHHLLPKKKSLLDAIKRQDIMLHYPYQSFQYIIDLLREASIDPQVREIKMTFYRAARDSSVINSLINAARNGKFVTVFLELQARFDEEANIYWTNRLQEEGVKIVQTIPGFKVHCKLLLIRRESSDGETLFANISTGNYNESTATVYADDSLLTANPEITTDVNNVFRLFETRYMPPVFKQLIVAPFAVREFFLRMLDIEIKNAKAGKEAWALLKLNSIVDDIVAFKLYEASQAGVKITMIVRGICILKAGVEGLSENINIISIVDRFLEHSRVYVFCNNHRNKIYIGSADLMQRNLDHRIEVLCPINDKVIQKELLHMLKIELADNTKARSLNHATINAYCSNNSDKKVRAQYDKYKYFKGLLKKSSPERSS